MKTEKTGKTIYLGHYGEGKRKRQSSPACNAMMKYVAGAIAGSGIKLTILSPAQLEEKEKLGEETIELFDNCECTFLPSVKKSHRYNLPLRFVKRMIKAGNLKKKLLSLLNDGDTLIVYHSLALMNIVRYIVKKKKIHLILQVCEIYADVLENDRIRKKEMEFIKIADSYIFSSALLEKQLNTEHKKYTICLGQYSSEDCTTDIKNDGKIHVVYAGTFDLRKGVIAALEATRYLDENYHLHVLGFGTDQEVGYVKQKIQEIKALTKCDISFEGCLRGKEYVEFLQKCDIGLSTQDPNAPFNATSFPSKILSYLSNGLKVVSIKIPAIDSSAVGKCLYYYTEQTPEQISNAIKEAGLSDSYDGRAIIKALDEDFKSDVFDIIKL